MTAGKFKKLEDTFWDFFYWKLLKKGSNLKRFNKVCSSRKKCLEIFYCTKFVPNWTWNKYFLNTVSGGHLGLWLEKSVAYYLVPQPCHKPRLESRSLGLWRRVVIIIRKGLGGSSKAGTSTTTDGSIAVTRSAVVAAWVTTSWGSTRGALKRRTMHQLPWSQQELQHKGGWETCSLDGHCETNQRSLKNLMRNMKIES